MLNELKRHKYAYTILVMGMLTSITFFLGVWPDRGVQRIVVLCFGLFYFLWGVTTHFKSRYVSKSVIYEYAGASLLGVCILLLLTV